MRGCVSRKGDYYSREWGLPSPILRSICAFAPGPGLAPAGPSPAAAVGVVALIFRQNNKSKSPSRTPMNLPKAMTNKSAFKAAMKMTMMMAMGRNNHHWKKIRGGGGGK